VTPAAPKEPKYAFVISPFGDPYDSYWGDIYVPALRAADLEPRRGDSIFAAGNVVRQIWDLILESDVVLAELSEQNANTYYELGLAHALAKPCVLITRDATSIPFDLRNQRHLTYDTVMPKWATRLEAEITSAIVETLANPARSLVFATDASGSGATAPTGFEASLLMLQASVDSLRSQLQPGAKLSEFRRDSVLPPADELEALAAALLMDGVDQGVVIEQLRTRGAPMVWATAVVDRLKDGRVAE